MESLRYLPYLSAKGWVVSNSVPFINIDAYPALESIIGEIEKLPQFVLLNADELAEQAGSARATNMVMLGAASPFINISTDNFVKGIQEQFARKGDSVVEINLKAFQLGREKSLQKIK
jgi:indolepyruvate ferredoxin oxidoreductase beta subunit